MNSSSNLAAMLDRCQTGITALLRQTTAQPERAGALADFLRESLPQSVLSACLLSGECASCLAVRPVSSVERERLLQSELCTLNPLAAQVQKWRTETLPDVQMLAAAIHTDGRSRGSLAIGLSSAAAEADVVRAETMLSVAAPILALRLSLDARQREEEELSRFALVGQAFIGLAHELNNALNSMMLQTSVVQLRVDAQARQDLASIRQHGAQAAGLVRTLQHVVQERRENTYFVDLNCVFEEVLEEAAELRRRVSPRLSPKAPQIQIARSALKQLVRLLLEGVCAGTEGTVEAATCAQDGAAVLSLTIAGPGDAESNVESLLWQNLDEVGRLAGSSLLRQQGGVATVERSNGGVILRILWKQTL